MDDESLDALYRTHQPELYRQLIRRFPWSGDLVEDGIHTAFLKLKTVDPTPDNPPAWINTVALRHVIDGLRAQGKIADDESAILDQPLTISTAGGTTTGKKPTPTLVQRALLTLTSRAQRLLRGKYMEDKTYRTLARQEGVATSSMGRLLDRARERLRQAVRGMR